MSKFVVYGLDADGHRQMDTESVSFVIFCPSIMEWLPTKFESRSLAEFIRDFYEKQIDYYAVTEFGHVKLYRLDAGYTSNLAMPPIATFTNVDEFERFTRKSIKEFNYVP